MYKLLWFLYNKPGGEKKDDQITRDLFAYISRLQYVFYAL